MARSGADKFRFVSPGIPASSGIYNIKNIITNKTYVGSAVNLKKRRNWHYNALRRNAHHSPKLQNAWNKYGESNFVFEILDIVSNKENLIKYEQLWFKQIKPQYNICKVAGSCLGKKHSSKAKEKMSFIAKQKKQKPSEECRRKALMAITGRTQSEKEKNKRSISLKKFYSENIHHSKDKKHSPKTIEKMRKSALENISAGKTSAPPILFGEKNKSSKLTWIQVNQMRKYKAKNPQVSFRQLGKLYNISGSTAQKIIANKLWKQTLEG